MTKSNVPPGEAATGSGDTYRAARTRRMRAGLLLGVLLAALVITRGEAIRDAWLERQPVDVVKNIVDHNPSDVFAEYVYALRMVDSGTPNNAVQPMGQAIQHLTVDSSPQLIGRVFALGGYVMAQRGTSRVAAENLRRAEVISRDDPFLYWGRGVLALHGDDAVTAVSQLQTAVRLAPDKAPLWDDLCKAYTAGADLDDAVTACRRCVQLAPGNPVYHADLALALGNLHRYGNAEAEYREAVTISHNDPYYVSLLAIGLASAARSDEEYRKAETMLRTALANHPGDYQLLDVLGGLDIRFLRFREARADYQASVNAFPQNDTAWYNLSVVCARLGDQQVAAAAARRYERIDNSAIGAAAQARNKLQRDGDSGAPGEVWETKPAGASQADGEDHL